MGQGANVARPDFSRETEIHIIMRTLPKLKCQQLVNTLTHITKQCGSGKAGGPVFVPGTLFVMALSILCPGPLQPLHMYLHARSGSSLGWYR